MIKFSDFRLEIPKTEKAEIIATKSWNSAQIIKNIKHFLKKDHFC